MVIHKERKEEGIVRTKTKFAFLPTRINEKTVVWLQKYYEKQIGILDWDLEFSWQVKERWI